MAICARDSICNTPLVSAREIMAYTRGSSAGREPPALGGRKTEDLAEVAQRAARAVHDDGRGERRALAAVLAVDVLQHLLAPLVLEIDVDVGRLAALARDEALEQQRRAALRVYRGHPQAVAHA